MNFVLYLLTKIKGKYPDYSPYPHENNPEVDLINSMYNTDFKEIRDWWLPGLYRDFLKANVEVSKESKRRAEKLTEEEFERLKKRLADVCPQKEKCKELRRCRPCCEAVGVDVADAIERLIGDGLDFRICKLYGWKKKDGNVYENSYPVLGEYLSKEKKVVLYVYNIDDACGEPTYNGVLSTYIHELFHAYFHYVTEQKQAEYNYIKEIEEAMTEFSTLVFIRFMKNELSGEWYDIFDWASESIGKKQNKIGALPAYGFGRYLFDNIPEDEAFDWINKYAERLGYIDEEDELVKQYKQMIYPCYPTEPGKCLELLRKILFETKNKSIEPRNVKGNLQKNMKNEAIIDSIICLLNEYRDEMLDPVSNKANLDSLKYLINQTIRAYDIPEKNHHLSQSAFDRWNELSTEDIMKKHYKDKVVCDKLTGPVKYVLYTGASKTGEPTDVTNGFEFRKMFHEDHVIPVSLIFDEMVKMPVVDKKSIENLLDGMHMCVILKDEDRNIGRTRGRSLDYDKTIEDVYNRYGIFLCKLA